MTNYVFVCDTRRRPLMPCHPARARELLNKGKAAVLKRYPFTIVLKYEVEPDPQPMELKIDPGSKVTGMALVAIGERGHRCIYGLNLTHRGRAISDKLTRRAILRRNRRNRKTRYRKPRFDNRTRPTGWLPPSIQHRIDTTLTWVRRFSLAAPVSSVQVEEVSFDTQKMMDESIKGKEYQHGTLHGYMVRHYLLQKCTHTCQYCSGVSKDKRLEVEHITPRSRGGVDSVRNLTLGCRTCNQDKGNCTPEEWKKRLLGKTDPLTLARLKGIDRVIKGRKPTLKDAAAVNATNRKLIASIREIGLPVYPRPAYLTAYNRHRHGYKKDHWIDACMVAAVCDKIYIPTGMTGIQVKCTGHGSRRMCSMDRYGFPKTKPKGPSRVFGFKTGDIVRAIVPSGKYAGHHVGRVSVMSSGWFQVGVIVSNFKHLNAIHRNDGYNYTTS